MSRKGLPRHYRAPIAELFARHVERRGECWIWVGAIGKHGYGLFNVDRRCVLAHRVAWQIASGQQAPKGLEICHRCDTPLCVNPAHLFVGTHADNMADGKNKNRFARSHCKNGHPLPASAPTAVNGRGYKYKVCVSCRQASSAASYRRAKQRAAQIEAHE